MTTDPPAVTGQQLDDREVSALIAEYQTGNAWVMHYDSFKWSAGGFLIAGVFIFWGAFSSSTHPLSCSRRPRLSSRPYVNLACCTPITTGSCSSSSSIASKSSRNCSVSATTCASTLDPVVTAQGTRTGRSPARRSGLRRRGTRRPAARLLPRRIHVDPAATCVHRHRRARRRQGQTSTGSTNI